MSSNPTHSLAACRAEIRMSESEYMRAKTRCSSGLNDPSHTLLNLSVVTCFTVSSLISGDNVRIDCIVIVMHFENWWVIINC